VIDILRESGSGNAPLPKPADEVHVAETPRQAGKELRSNIGRQRAAAAVPRQPDEDEEQGRPAAQGALPFDREHVPEGLFVQNPTGTVGATRDARRRPE
jgi:hypothetical protein